MSRRALTPSSPAAGGRPELGSWGGCCRCWGWRSRWHRPLVVPRTGLTKIYILTQFNSNSLNRHLSQTYNVGRRAIGSEGFVEVLAATQTPETANWFQVSCRSLLPRMPWCTAALFMPDSAVQLLPRTLLEEGKRKRGRRETGPILEGRRVLACLSILQGTADAVRQYTWIFEDIKNRSIEDLLVLAGDHLYRMDYMDFVMRHRETDADITVGCIPCDEERASAFGLMKIDGQGRIVEFKEKPKGAALQSMKASRRRLPLASRASRLLHLPRCRCIRCCLPPAKVPPVRFPRRHLTDVCPSTQVDTTILGLSPVEAKDKPYIASMGIYVFKKRVMIDLLKHRYPTANDFGGEIIPRAAEAGLKVQGYLFNDYWEDIGTIKSFFESNLALAHQPPRFEFYDPTFPIYTYPHFLPPANVMGSK